MSAAPAVAASLPGDRVVDAENPWPGLAAFREADAAFFHGRDDEADALYRCVLRERLTVLFGVAGLGKTSLLRAGLFGRLRSDNVLPVYIRLDYCPQAPPLRVQVECAISAAALEAAVEAAPFVEGETLWEYFHRDDGGFWNRRNRPVTPLLAFDQFEEAFTLGRATVGQAAATRAFLAELADLVEGRPPDAVKHSCDTDSEWAKRYNFQHHTYKVLLSFREDFLPNLEALRKEMPSIVHNRQRLLPMDAHQALRVVTQSGGALIREGVAQQVVGFVAGADPSSVEADESLQVEPTLLSLVCRELNLCRQQRHEPQITADLLQGNKDEILVDFYQRCTADIGVELRTLIEDRLLTKAGYRASMAEPDVLASPGVTKEQLQRLYDRHMLRREQRGGVAWVELMHDVLTGVVREMRDARQLRERAEQADAALREAQQAQLREVEERRRRREVRRLRWAAGICGTFLCVAVVAAWSAVQANRRANVSLVQALEAKRDADAALGQSELRDAGRLLEADRAPEALRKVSLAVLHAPASAPVRARLLSLLLQRQWWLPQQVVSLSKPSVGRAVALSADGSRMVVAPDKDTVRVCDVRQIKAVSEAPPIDVESGARAKAAIDAACPVPLGPVGGRGTVSSAEISADGRWAALGWGNGIVDLSSLEGARVVPSVAHSGQIRSIDFSPDSPARIVTASDDATARVWLVRDGAPVGAPLRHAQAVLSARFSPDGRRILTASADGFARVWDAATGQLVLPLLDHGGKEVRVARFSPDGSRIVTASGPTAWVWNAATHAPTGQRMRHLDVVTDARFDPDGRLLVTASNDRTARVWDVRTGDPLGEPMRHRAGAPYLAQFTGNPAEVVTANWDWWLLTWRAASPPSRGLVLRSAVPVQSARFSADGTRVLARSAEGTDTELVWDSRTGAALPRSGPAANGAEAAGTDTGSGRTVRITGAGESTTCTQEAGVCHVTVVDTAGKALFAPISQSWPIHAAQLSPDGRILVLASKHGNQDDRAHLWDAGTGERLGVELRHTDTVLAAEFSPDGKRVVTASEDGSAKVWSVRGYGLEPLRHHGPVRSARFSPDGSRVVTASDDEAVRVWDARTGQLLSDPLRPGEGGIRFAGFSPDGERVLAVSSAGVTLWDAPAGREQDATRLLEFAQAVGGFAVIEAPWSSQPNERVAVSDQPRQALERLERLRLSVRSPAAGVPLESLIARFFGDPATRGPSSFSKTPS